MHRRNGWHFAYEGPQARIGIWDRNSESVSRSQSKGTMTLGREELDVNYDLLNKVDFRYR